MRAVDDADVFVRRCRCETGGDIISALDEEWKILRHLSSEIRSERHLPSDIKSESWCGCTESGIDCCGLSYG